MPSIRVLGNPLARETKRELALTLSRSLKNVLSVPIAEVFFQEFDEYYVLTTDFSICGEGEKNGGVTLIINAPPVDEDKLADLCAELTAGVRSVLNDPEYGVIFVYHPIDPAHIGSNGVIHSRRPKKKG